MRLSLSATTALMLASSGHFLLAFASASDGGADVAGAGAEPKPDTIPEVLSPTKTTTQQQKVNMAARQTSSPSSSPPNILGAIWQLASNFQLRACVPAALPLITTLPRIPAGVLGGDAISQALSQTTRELGQVCDFSITGAAGAAFTSFLPTWYSWYDRYSDSIQSVVTKCPKASSLVSTVEAYTTCPQVQAVRVTAEPTSTSTTTAAASTTTTSGSDVATPTTTIATTETTGSDSHSAARETGFLGAAAAAAAGVLGVVAVL
ncbi:hypothetical protein F5Y17DRAFT_191943 [Xylariaceae sp. FL0594]|nr:hypothetical protein F5Y17DRAFT_191943 [Xylariaceae sp. FL0594]